MTIFTEIKTRQMRTPRIFALLLCLAACIPVSYAASAHPAGTRQAESCYRQDGFQAYFCDSTLRIPLDSRLVRTARDIPTWVFCARADAGRKVALEQAAAVRIGDVTVPLT